MRTQTNARLETEIKATHMHTKETYRPERLQADLADSGIQVGVHRIKHKLGQFGMQLFMSCKGNCWDNAPIESFWGSLKTERVHHRRFINREQAKRGIVEYIEIFYNRTRKLARLGCLSPIAFNQQH